MAKQEFKLEKLLALDGGRVLEAWNQAVQRCAADCDDRPGVKDARKVTMTLELSPIADEHGHVDDIKAKFVIKDSAPVRKSKTYSLGIRNGGMLIFNPDSDDDINQGTLLTEDEG